MRALVVLLVILSGCAAHHASDQRGDPASADSGGPVGSADFDVPERSFVTPVPAGSCTDTSFVELLPPGGSDVRYASLAPLGNGLFLTYEDYATAPLPNDRSPARSRRGAPSRSGPSTSDT